MPDDFKTEATKTVEAVIREADAKLKLLVASQRIFLCGDFEPETIGILNESKKRLIAENCNPFILVPDEKKLDHMNKELIALTKADVIALIDGQHAGTWTETVLTILKEKFGKKVIFFYDRKTKDVEDIGNCQDYHLHFPSKYGYESKEDLIKQIVIFSKQRAHHNAAIIIRDGVIGE